MKETDNCKYVERPQGFRHCNTHHCTESTATTPKSLREIGDQYDPKVDLIQNDIATGKSQYDSVKYEYTFYVFFCFVLFFQNVLTNIQIVMWWFAPNCAPTNTT